MKKASVLMIVLFFPLMNMGAQESEYGQEAEYIQDTENDEGLALLIENLLQVNITARVLGARVIPPDEKPLWEIEGTQLTIPGRAIKIQLQGENFYVLAFFTPYRIEDGSLLLFCQGQVWLREPPEYVITIANTYRSIDISLGERVLFFPLGLSEEYYERQSFNIELEVQVVPYVLEESAE